MKKEEAELSVTPRTDNSASLLQRMAESSLFLLSVLLAGIFLAEGAIMYLLYRLPPLPPRTEGILDAAMLTILVFPVLYVFAFRPLIQQLKLRRMTEKALEASKSHTESIIRNFLDSLIVVDMEARIRTVNPETCSLLGYTEEELVGQYVGKIFEEEEEEEEVKAVFQFFKDHDVSALDPHMEVRNVSLTYVRKDGHRIPMSFNTSTLTDDNGNITGVVAGAKDISGEKQVQRALQESKEYTENILRSMTDALFVVAPDATIQTVNTAASALTGYTEQEFQGMPIGKIFEEEEEEEEEVFSNVDRSLVAKDGKRIPVLMSGAVMSADSGEIGGRVLIAKDITDRKRNEEALKASEERYRRLVELSPDIIVTHQEGKILFANSAAMRFVGAENRQQLIGKSVLDFVHPDDRETVTKRIRLMFEEGKKAPLSEERFLRLDGTAAYVEAQAVPFDYEGKPAAQVVARDISDRKESQEKEHAHTERLHALHEATQALVTSLDFRKVVVRCSTVARELIGADGATVYLVNREGTRLEPVVTEGPYAKETMATPVELGEGVTGKVAVSGRAQIVNRVDLTDKGKLIPGTPLEPESLLCSPLKAKKKVIGVITLRRLGEWEFVDEDLEFLQNLANISASAIVNARLFTETQRSHEEIERLANFPRESPMPVVEVDLRCNPTYINPAGESLLKRLKVKRDQVQRILPSDCHKLVKDCLGGATDIPPTEVELDDSVLLWTGHFLKELGLVHFYAIDITDRKRAEEVIRTSKEYTENLIGSSLDMIIAVDNDRRITEFNRAAQDTFGYSREEVVGKHVNILYEDEEEGHAVHEATATKGRHIQEVLNRRKNGEVFPSLLSASVLLDPEGNRIGVMGVSRDITKRKKAEEEIRKLNEELENRVEQRTSELKAANEELESFAYSVSHDLRAPLRAIDGFSDILLEDYGDKLDDQGKDSLGRVRSSAQQMGQLIDDLLELSRVTRSKITIEKVDLTQMAKEVAAELQETDPKRRVDFKIHDGLVGRGDSPLLRVVLENLMGNAWKFTGRKRRAEIEFGLTEVNGRPAYFVRDNGVGFDMAYVDKLFTPFERLHGETEFKGTGIGLASVKRIILRHGGGVWAESKEGSGATFYFTLQHEKEKRHG